MDISQFIYYILLLLIIKKNLETIQHLILFFFKSIIFLMDSIFEYLTRFLTYMSLVNFF